MADKKPSNRERIKEIVTGIETGIQDLFQSDKFADYLRTMSRFHSYSYNNTILIHMQMPNATHVAGFNKWKNQFGRHVKKGEKGLTIIAPTPFKKRIEEMKLDPDTRAPVLDNDGNVVMEEREIEIPLFRPVKVFDVSQTEGKPLPSLVSPLTGDVQHYEAFMEALRRTSPVPMQFKPLREGLDGFLSLEDQSITIREGMSQVQTVCAAVHEITHAMLHNREREQLTAAAGDTDQEPPKPKDKNTKEVEAESVSYTVCQYYGIETSANSLGYIATWSKDKTLPELKASLETISKTANILITSIDRHFQEICKERGIDLTAQQPEQDALTAASDTPERFISDLLDMLDRLYQAGTINRNFPPDGRDKIKANLIRTLHINPSIVRATLEQFVRQDTGAAEAKVMLERLDGLAQSVPLKEYVYKIEANPRTVGERDRHFIQAYERTAEGTLKPDRVLFFGTADICTGLLKRLQSSELGPDDFFQTSTARISHYTTTDGADLDAFVGLDNKVYIGRRDHYDNHGHYIDDGGSLIYLSDNKKMFDFISGGNYSDTQAELLAQGCFTMEDYAEFDFLRVRMLAQFKQAEPILFAGEPFRFIQPDAAELEQSALGPLEPADAALYLVDGTTYLHIQISEGSYDYTLYDKATLRQLDGGQMAILDVGGSPQANFRNAADLIILGERNLQGTSVEPVPLDILDTLQNAEEQAVQAAVTEVQDQRKNHLDELREHFAQEDDALWDTPLDEYPLPDPTFPADELEQNYGYTGGDLLPLSRERAAQLLEQDLTVYMVETGENPAMVFDRDDLMEQPEGMMFAVTREEWEASRDFRQAVVDRMQHQPEREKAFLDHAADCFAIYQVRDDDALRDIRFESLDWLKSKGRAVERDNYDLVYTATLSAFASVDAALDQLWYQFNNEHPADFRHPSMSVSDIIALKRDGVVTCHYCDSFGFEQLTDFISQRPTVAELEAQVKAGQTISLTDLADAVHREKGQKKSVVAQLKSQPTQERKKTAPKKSAEKER